MEAFYYNQMSKVEQAVYHAMKIGFSEMATSFLVPRVEAKVLGEVFFRMRLDHPEIFYAVNFKYRSYRDSLVYISCDATDIANVLQHFSDIFGRVKGRLNDVVILKGALDIALWSACWTVGQKFCSAMGTFQRTAYSFLKIGSAASVTL